MLYSEHLRCHLGLRVQQVRVGMHSTVRRELAHKSALACTAQSALACTAQSAPCASCPYCNRGALHISIPNKKPCLFHVPVFATILRPTELPAIENQNLFS